MPKVSREEFARQLREHERVRVIIFDDVDDLDCYISKHPKPVGDKMRLGVLVERLVKFLPPGKWTLVKADGSRIMNRNAYVSSIRYKE